MSPPDARHTAYLKLAKTLGQRTAEFHQALAQPDAAGAFGSEPVSADDIIEWVNRVQHEMHAMFERLEQALPQLPEAVWPIARSLLAARPRLYRRIVRAAAVRLDARKTRCHGHYHLGQVWLAGNDLLIANYGGEPGRSWAERRRKRSPFEDVADMLTSLSEAGDAALNQVADNPAETGEALQRQVDDWALRARRTFYRSYRKAMSGHPLHLADAPAAAALLSLFLAEKAIARVNDALTQRSGGVDGTIRRLLRVTQR